MKCLIYLTLPLLLNAQSPFESVATAPHMADMFNSTKNKIYIKVSENEKIKCRYVCDKKIYREQVIADAIAYYINSKDYSFSTYNSSK